MMLANFINKENLSKAGSIEAIIMKVRRMNETSLHWRFIFHLSGGHYGGKCEGTKSSNCVRNEKLTGCCNLQSKSLLKWSSRVYLCVDHGEWWKKT